MEYLNNIFLATFLNATYLIIWFLTNAYYEYASIILPFLFKDYQSHIKNNSFVYYAEYLEIKNNFLNKLFSCPFCLGFWSSLVCGALYDSIMYICVIYTASLLLFFMVKKYAGIN